ncbi:hypothetical protein B0T10DRAFT_466710 [Thelonectria olida]|uniref:NACHT domain-containing protein n=1 Tax=Thelonectria olida TaxID=1576542 RepID=A0A9P8VSJ3_9HYPO|nr:hypothetical protein B0T10DRAFT_466710 [Thelonectria olida]
MTCRSGSCSKPLISTHVLLPIHLETAMEVLAAIGLASNLIQFVDCLTKVVKSCWNLWYHEEVCLEESRELEIAVKSLQEILGKLESDTACSIDDTLIGLIQDYLGSVPKERGKRKFDKLIQSIVLSIRQIVKKEEITNLKLRIDAMRDAIFVRLNFHSQSEPDPRSNRFNDIEATSLDSGETASGIPRSTTLGETGSTMRNRIEEIIRGSDEVQEGRASMLNAASQLASLAKELPSLQPEMVKFNKTRAIVTSLHFRQIRERESKVAAAHAQTFEWVTGKAGSGKSTFMKFLVQHLETHRLLRNWAQGYTLVMARHFFWSAGPSIQKSQAGLLRTVLFVLLVNCPNLAPVFCPRRWNDQTHCGLGDWTRSELLKCLNNLASATELPFRVCLFIDGLDEYDGDHVELARVLLALADLPNIKICTSSRAWVDFLDAFGSSPWKLSIHELIATDINMFVTDMFLANQQFCKIQASNGEAAQYLMAEIGPSRGLTNEDDMADLNRRLFQIPVELEDFFRRMLDNIDHVYWQRTARLLQLVKCASGPIPLPMMLYLDLNGGTKSPGLVVPLDRWPDISPEVAEMVRVKKRQITAQCKDILHITTTPNQPSLLGERLGPLHRTVVDFLQTDHIDQLLCQRAGPEFEHWTMLFNATIVQIRDLVPVCRLVHISDTLPLWMGDAIDYACHMEADYGHTETESLNDLERALANYSESRRWSLEYCLSDILGETGCLCFLSLAVKRGLRLYAKEKVQSCSNYDKVSVLECALGGRPCAGQKTVPLDDQTGQRNTEVVNHLLAMGILPSSEMVSRGLTITTYEAARLLMKLRLRLITTNALLKMIRAGERTTGLFGIG